MTFKAGDRVAAYSAGERYIGVIERELNEHSYMFQSSGSYFAVHAKQLRPLKKRVAREWWLIVDEVGNVERGYQMPVNKVLFADNGKSLVHVREIKRREAK